MTDFDSTFDYTAVIAGLQNERSALDSRLIATTAEKTLLESATAYISEPSVSSRIATLQNEADMLQSAITRIDETLTEIQALTSETEERKADLYFFYTTVGATKQDFMARMPFNYTAALADQKIQDLRADQVTPVEAKVAVAKLLYQKYPVNSTHANATLSVYRYIRLL
jgi:hypothetical protein